MYKIENYSFKTERDKRFAQACLDNKKYLLFATCVDYPGLYKIPMYLYDGVRRELKEMGFLLSYPKNYSDTRHRAKLFFLGPRVDRGRHYRACSTRKQDATSFKVYFIFVTDWLKAQVAAKEGK